MEMDSGKVLDIQVYEGLIFLLFLNMRKLMNKKLLIKIRFSDLLFICSVFFVSASACTI